MHIPPDPQASSDHTAAVAQAADASAPAGAKDAHAPATRTWVPIRSLGQRHRARITAHLIALQESDRYFRFGYPATDAQISKYVDMLDFEQDEVFGVFNRRLELIAMAHLAHATVAPLEGHPKMSEFGVSVLPQARKRGFGKRLFEHAILHASNRGVETLFIHALSENRAMLKIARSAGAIVERDGSESQAWLKLPPDTFASHVGEMVGHQAAELDYLIKVNVRQANNILDAVSEVRTSLSKAANVAEE